MIITDVKRKIPTANISDGPSSSLFGGPMKKASAIAAAASATTAANRQPRKIADSRTNGENGVKATPVTNPSTDNRIIAGTATAAKPQNSACLPVTVGAESQILIPSIISRRPPTAEYTTAQRS
jgi:hypothetical protein